MSLPYLDTFREHFAQPSYMRKYNNKLYYYSKMYQECFEHNDCAIPSKHHHNAMHQTQGWRRLLLRSSVVFLNRPGRFQLLATESSQHWPLKASHHQYCYTDEVKLNNILHNNIFVTVSLISLKVARQYWSMWKPYEYLISEIHIKMWLLYNVCIISGEQFSKESYWRCFNTYIFSLKSVKK